MASSKVLEMIAITAQIYGKEFAPATAQVLAADLEGYPEQSVLAALSRCRKECRQFPTLSEILARIDDGRPGAEEAWAMIPKDESASVVWSDEMAGAFDVARHLIDEDPIAARMAFKETYSRLISDARASGAPVRWTPSLGHDKRGRQAALQEAVERGRLSAPHAQELLPDQPINPKVAALIGGSTKRLT